MRFGMASGLSSDRSCHRTRRGWPRIASTLGTSSQVVDMSGGVNTALSAAVTTVGALRFNSNAARTITLNSATTSLTVNGGILVTGSVGSNTSTITGGFLQGSGGRDLL